MATTGISPSKLSKIKVASLRDTAYHQLRALIMQQTLAHGAQLVIEQLADELGISRTPLREAIAMLENEGLVETVRNKGTFVAGLSEEKARQIMQVREALEALAIRLCADRLPDDQIARLEALFAEHRERIELGDMESDRLLNVEFHGTLAQYSGNSELSELITNYEERVNLYLIATGRRTKPGNMAASFSEHLGILEALKLRNVSEAERLMVHHLQASTARSAPVYSEPPEQALDA